MVDNSTGPFQAHFGPVFGDEAVQMGLLFPEQGSIECFCEHLPQTPRNMTLHPHLTLAPLRRKSATMDKKAPLAPSIVDVFSLLPWQGFGGGLVVPDVCPLVLEAS